MTKFDEETRQKIIMAIRKGATYEIACNYGGVNYKNFREWIKRGIREPDTEYGKFRMAIKEAEGHTALVWLDKIDAAMVEQWQAAAWKLERRYYKDFSSNPLVRKELKTLEKKLKRIEKRHRQGDVNVKIIEAKELDKGSNKTQRCITQGIESADGTENTSKENG